MDKPFLYTLITLTAGGLLILASASIAVSQRNFGTMGYYTLRQFVFGVCGGAIAFLVTYHIPYRLWKKAAVPLMILSLVLLALLFIPEISFAAGGARRWLRFGHFSFQPSEILKFSFIIYLASWLDARRRDVASIAYGFIPFILMLAIVGAFLVMQPDIGMLGVILVGAGMIYFLGGGLVSQMTTLAIFGLSILFLLIRLAPYRVARVLVFLNPGIDPQGIGYQMQQALIAIGSGGFFGRGFGQGAQKYYYLPEVLGDSIFAAFSEETGFLGATLLIGALLFFLWRGCAIAKRAPDSFGMLLASGLVSIVLLQAFINMAAISGLLPLTGIPLPFVSYGSTAFVVTLAGAGIIANISKYQHIKK
ncbi:MAG: putative peptidoglycan glycosyltransferase FtsW [Patescibacteria group bacterium]